MPARIAWSDYELKDDLNGKRADFARERFALRDSWTGQPAGTTATPFEATIGPHDTLVFRLTPLTN